MMKCSSFATTIDPVVAFFCGLIHALCSLGQTRREMQRSGPGAVSREAIPSLAVPMLRCCKNPRPKQQASWLAENTRQQTAAPLPADLFTAVIYHHVFAPHTVRIPAGAAASAPARAGTACQAREHTGTRDGHGE